MKLNNKGVTLVEIIISVALISIVLIFLFSLLIQVNNENSDNELKSSYLINQATFTKQIEEDFIEYKLQNGSECEYNQIKKGTEQTNNEKLYLPRLYDNTAVKNSNIKCLKFNFDQYSTYTYAYLFLYKREDNKTILSYYRGDFKQSQELEEFDWVINNYDVQVPIDNGINSMYTYSLPIIGPDYNDYSINLSYIKTS